MLHLNVPVSHYLVSPVQTISLYDDLHTAAQRMAELSLSSLAVVDGTLLVGAVSRTDLLRAGRVGSMAARGEGRGAVLALPQVQVREVMRAPAITVSRTDSLATAARLMMQHHVHRVFVLEKQHLVGVVSTRDLMRAVRDARSDPRLGRDIGSLMSTPVLTVDADAPVSQAIDLLAQAHVRGLVVVENRWPVGLFTQAEALAAREEAPVTPVESVMSYALLCLPPQTPAHRAAGAMHDTRARRVVVVEQREARGVLTGIDLAALIS